MYPSYWPTFILDLLSSLLITSPTNILPMFILDLFTIISCNFSSNILIISLITSFSPIIFSPKGCGFEIIAALQS
jgi:hypothetical protein